MIGHGDWITDNLRWDGNRLLVAYDWDSLIARSEAAIAGLAAAIYLYPALPTVTETREFLDAYATARGRPLSPGELQRCWAAGVWTKAYDAKQEHAAGQPVTCLTQDEAHDRLRRAGMRWTPAPHGRGAGRSSAPCGATQGGGGQGGSGHAATVAVRLGQVRSA